MTESGARTFTTHYSFVFVFRLFEEGGVLYSLLKTSGLRHVLERELVPFAVALLIAQIWFKWGSFALELIGFIAMWLVLGFVADVVLRPLKR